MAGSLKVTTKSFTSTKTNPSHTEQTILNASFQNIVGAVAPSAINQKHFARFRIKDGGANTISMQVVGVTTGTVYKLLEQVINSATYLEKILDLGVIETSENLQLQIKDDTSPGVTVEADSFHVFSSPTTNITDSFFRASVTSVRMYGTTTEALLGVKAKNGGTDWVTIDVNAIVSRFIWSANSGNVLWDWNGVSLEVTP